MEIRQLIYFVEVCKLENMRVAAEHLYLTPQALSKSILAMEHELQAPLFIRDKGKLSLTKMGKVLRDEAKQFLEIYESMIHRVKIIGEQEQGHLRIAFGHGIMNMLKEEFIEEYQNEHRDVFFDMIELPDLFAERYVQQEECNMGFSIGIPHDAEDFDYFKFRHYEICAVVHPHHEYAHRNEISIEDLVNHPIITKNKLFKIYTILEECAKAHHITLTYALSSPDETLWRSMVDNNLGIGIGTTMLEHLPKGNLVCLKFKEKLSWDIFFFVKKNCYASKDMKEFIAYFQSLRSREITINTIK